MSSVIEPLTVTAAWGVGLIAGLFFVFSVAIMPAFARLAAPTAIAAMRAINVVIVRPLFLTVFLGSALACAGLVVLAPDPLRLVAAGCYLIGVVGVTAVRNVPLNNALDRVTPDGADEAALWSRYLSRWTAWNHVRTVASAAAALALILAA